MTTKWKIIAEFEIGAIEFIKALEHKPSSRSECTIIKQSYTLDTAGSQLLQTRVY